MPIEDASNAEGLKQQTNKTEKKEELTDSELESVTGGLTTTGGTALTDTGVCVSTF